MYGLDDFSQITPIHGDPYIASSKLYIVEGKKVVYKAGKEVGIPVIGPGDEVPPPGTVVYLLDVPGIADGMYEVSQDSEYLPEGSTNKLLP